MFLPRQNPEPLSRETLSVERRTGPFSVCKAQILMVLVNRTLIHIIDIPVNGTRALSSADRRFTCTLACSHIIPGGMLIDNVATAETS
jgi:hypothetical protein